jgi:DNA-binding NarL/FixJ family response regulator
MSAPASGISRCLLGKSPIPAAVQPEDDASIVLRRADMKILVIDPNPLFRQASRNFIAALPECECRVAASLQDALRHDETRRADMILIDYALGRRCAGDGVRALRTLAPAARIVLLAEDAAAYRDSSLAAGADDCTGKDALGSDLPRLLAGLARRGGREARS